MPRPKAWLGRITQIISHLEEIPESSLTRREVEELFQIGRSAAAALMDVVGIRSVRALDGGALVTSESLLHYLRHSPEAANAMQEAARRKKLAVKLAQADQETKYRRIPLPINPADEWCTLAELPNVSIEGGMLRVAFSSPLELMGDLYRLCKAAGNDWDAFERACSQTSTSSRNGDGGSHE
jgi:hypothetical protein